MKRILVILLCAGLLLSLSGCGEEKPLSFSFEDYDFPEMTHIVIGNYVTQKRYTVSDSVEIEKILSFLRTVQGTDGISAKGFYGGTTYQIQFWNGENRVEYVTFLTHDEFDFGDFGDGYPVKYLTSTPNSREVVDFFCQYDEEYDSEDWPDDYLYHGTK